MKSTSRSILDAYNLLLRLCKRRLRVSDPDHAVGLQERRTVVTGGSRSDTNPLETRVNGPETATFDFDWPTAELFRLRDTWLTGDQGQVFLKDGSLFEPWVRPYNLAKLKIMQPLKLGATKIDGTVFHLTGRNHENRGHFMLQHLPRLMAARDYLRSLPDYRILVAPGHSRWQGRYIAWAGLDPSKLVEGTRGTMQVDDLIFIPNLYGKSSLCPPPFYNELSDCAASYPVPDGPGRPLFITRRDAPDKQLMNEERIVEILRAKIGPVDLIRLGEHPCPIKSACSAPRRSSWAPSARASAMSSSARPPCSSCSPPARPTSRCTPPPTVPSSPASAATKPSPSSPTNPPLRVATGPSLKSASSPCSTACCSNPKPPGLTRRPVNPRRILAIKNKHLGDVICGVPAFRALHTAFPQAELDIIVSPGSRALIAGFDWIHAVIESPRKLKGLARVRDELRVAKAVATGGYDLVVDFTWSDRAMWYAALSRASRRWAIQVTAGSKLKPHIFNGYGGKPDRSHHVMEHEREFLMRMGIPYYDIHPDFPPTPAEDQEARDWLAAHGVQRDKLVVVHPTSRWLFKCWHDDRVAEVIDWLTTQGWQPVVTCGPSADELKRARNIVSLVRQPCLSRLGDMSLRHLAAFMRQARFFFGMDSAPSHMASAVGLPAVILFGPSQVKRWRPFGAQHIILHRDCPCIAARGADLACDKTQIVKCMSAIATAEVTSAIQSRFPAPTASH